MEISTQENSAYKTFEEPAQVSRSLDALQDKIQSLTSEFERVYVLSKMHPENQEYQHQYANLSQGMARLKKEFHSMESDLQDNIDQVNASLKKLDKEIRQQKQNNKVLKRTMGMVEEETNASATMIDDYTTIYKERYLRNWGLILSSLLAIVAIRQSWKSK